MASHRILINSSVIIEFFCMQDKAQSLLYHLFTNESELYISALTYYELMCGAVSAPLQRDTANVLSLFQIVEFGFHKAALAARLYQRLKKVNQLVDVIDILIAASARLHSLRVATLNAAHFSRFDEITLFDVLE